jgi:UPF0176 protein
MKERYRVLLYYKFVEIDNIDAYVKRHLKFCKSVGLKGRILIAEEGINGTVSGTVAQTDAYIHALHMDPRFEDMAFKIDEVEDHTFKKLFVRKRDQIITLFPEHNVNPNEVTGKHLKPKEWRDLLEKDDVLVLDGRNDYEYEIGHFRNAIRPDVTSFREFPEWIKENLSEHKDKKILSYCTGGIRCEKLTGVLLKQGFKHVFQLDGGIVNYGKDPDVQGELFDGKCYVFDERISVPIDRNNKVIVSNCMHCGEKSDRYINCANPECNLQHVSCESCEKEKQASCCNECRVHPRNRYEMWQKKDDILENENSDFYIED